ncbi:MAG: hypothetical protein EPO19_13300 [Betaproteobacteria bacterium]|nr:MAG: hypothetical protein EPO19_13300 [Betaproteobacteria bacterium]
MKLGASDLKRLRLPMAACAALAVAGVGCYFAADNYLRETKKLGAATSAQRAEVQARLASANEEEREIKANLQEYKALAARGVIGEEKRLDWIDALTAIKNERRLFNIGYSIEPQKELDYPGLAPTGGVHFVSSRVKIDIQLLHEEDLLNFIDDLNKRGKLYLSPRSCEVKRTDRSSGTVLAPRLQANCVFDLITIRHNKPA